MTSRPFNQLELKRSGFDYRGASVKLLPCGTFFRIANGYTFTYYVKVAHGIYLDLHSGEAEVLSPTTVPDRVYRDVTLFLEYQPND